MQKDEHPLLHKLEKVSIKVVLALVALAAIYLLVATSPRAGRPSESAVQGNLRMTGWSVEDYDFYPLRAEDCYSDMVFDFGTYLRTLIAHDIYTDAIPVNDNTMDLQLQFTYKDIHYTLTTEVCGEGKFSQLTIETADGRILATPNINRGEYVMDSRSPFCVDRYLFDLFHVLTSGKAADYRDDITDADNTCPMHGLGVGHYEVNPDGSTFWHDDAGDPKDLHF